MNSSIFDSVKASGDDRAFMDLFECLLVGMHFDFRDEHDDWYEAIVRKIRICPKQQSDEESDCKTQSVSHVHSVDILNQFSVKLLVHCKNFSFHWDQWIDLASSLSAVSALRTYSNCYDVDDSVKPLAEIVRELDEQMIVSIDALAQSLKINKSDLIKWVNSENVQWQNEQKEQNVDKMCKFLKDYLLRNKQSQNYLISRDYFVKAGSYSDKRQHIICNAVLPNSCEVELDSLKESEQKLIQQRVIENLRGGSCAYFEMANECGVSLALFQQIVFGITDLLPRFLIQQIVQWAQGMPLQNMDFAIKEEQMFYVKIQ